MAQRRMVSKRLTQSAKVSVDLQGNDAARFVYVALLPYTDREGRVNANPYGLAGTIFEAFEYDATEIASALQALADVGLIELYQTKTHKLIASFTKFTDFNTPHKREGPSDFPTPGTTGTEKVTDAFAAASVPLPGKVPESSGNLSADAGGKSPAEMKGTESTVDPVRGRKAGAAPEGGAPSEDDPPELAERLANLPEGTHAYIRKSYWRNQQKSEGAKRLEAFTLKLQRGEA